MVPPTMDELALEPPELVKQGPNYSVRLKASAPSLQLVRTDIRTEVTPFAGSESQSQALATALSEQMAAGDEALWDTEIFGQTLGDLVREGMNGKLDNLPEDARGKLREALEKILNEGGGGMICIML